MTQSWSTTIVIETITSLYMAGEFLNFSHVRDNYPKLIGAAKRHFGSWPKALAAAGLSSDTIKKAPRKRARVRRKGVAIEGVPEHNNIAYWPDDIKLDEVGIALRDLTNHRLLEEDELIALFKERGNESVRNKIAHHNLRLVVAIAKKYRNRGIEFLDLIQEGTLGLMHAIEKFEPERGYRFSTYAVWWIKQGIRRALADKSHTIRVPVYLRERVFALRKAIRKLGAHRTIAELAEETELSEKQVKHLLPFARREAPLSLEFEQSDNTGTTLGATLECDATSEIPEKDTLFRELLENKKQKVENLVVDLARFSGYSRSRKKFRAFRLRLGIGESFEKRTLEEVSKLITITCERVRQRVDELWRKLRPTATPKESDAWLDQHIEEIRELSAYFNEDLSTWYQRIREILIRGVRERHRFVQRHRFRTTVVRLLKGRCRKQRQSTAPR